MVDSLDRRGKRRQQTIGEILAIAVDLMGVHGVAALSLSGVARRLGIQPPSLFKYFPSKLALYDALFARSARGVLAAFRESTAGTPPGIPALRAGVAAIGRWSLANQALAQLVFWRPVPGFAPSDEALQPSVELVEEIRGVLRAAVTAGQLRPEAAGEQGRAMLSALIAGAMTQQMANEPDADLHTGRFTSLLPRLIDMYVLAYGPRP